MSKLWLYDAKSIVLVIFRRFKHKSHWLTSKKNNAAKIASKHFDDFYPKVYGDDTYRDIREALLENPQYMAVVNNFADSEITKTNFEQTGAFNLRKVYRLGLDFMIEKNSKSKARKSNNPLTDRMGDSQTSAAEWSSPGSAQNSTTDYSRLSITKSLQKSEIDFSRIVDFEQGVGNDCLYDFVPATKIKTMDENWVRESEHYEYYKTDPEEEFPVSFEKEHDLQIPDTLDVYFYDENAKVTFKNPRNNTVTGVFNYILLNGGSILPVLALDVKNGDCVLDMCSSPGVKSYAIMQTLRPKLLVCNDVSLSRLNKVRKLMKEYFYDFDTKWLKENRIMLSDNDGRLINDKAFYDKILLDAPCTNDRHSIQEIDNNIFKSSRLRERLHLPEEQADLLFHALDLVKDGGNVVYSTCTLSPVQNDGVVHMALKKIWQQTKHHIIVKDLSPAIRPLRNIFRIAPKKVLRYGNVIFPDSDKNFGPTYVCKFTKATK